MRVLLAPSDVAHDGPPVDAYDFYGVPAQPWLRINMVVSLNGAAADEQGRSGGLAGPGDRLVFRALRGLADAILVGAGTVRAERYGPHRPSGPLRERRLAEGRAGSAPIVVVTRSGVLDYDAALFTEAEQPTVVLSCSRAPRSLRGLAASAGRLIVAGQAQVDLAEGLRRLREELGLASILCEGGPRLNGALIGADLVDEVCTTVSPQLAAPPFPGLVDGLAAGRRLGLTGVLEHQGELFLRHRVLAGSEQP